MPDDRSDPEFRTTLELQPNGNSLDQRLDGRVPPADTGGLETTDDRVDPKAEAKDPASTALSMVRDWGPFQRLTRIWMMWRKDKVEFWQDRDLEKNQAGKLPPDERIAIPSVWVAELYTPSNIDDMLWGISNLRWEHGKARDESLLKWMNDVREGRLAGWRSLGLVCSPDEPHLMMERTAPLPEGVSIAHPILLSLTPSITALVMLFIMDDETSNALNEPLRAHYETQVEKSPLFRYWHLIPYILWNRPLRSMRSIRNPDMRRRETARAVLGQMEEACVRWVRENLPGVFATGTRGSMFPTAALILTDETPPSAEEARSIRSFSGLSIDRDYDCWKSDEWPSARLMLPRSWDEEGLRLTFACRRRDAFPDSPCVHDTTSDWTIAQQADRLVRGLLVRWALNCQLDGYHQELAKLRDRSAADRSYRPIRDLKQLRSLVRTQLYDIKAAATEIGRFVADDASYRYDVLEMEQSVGDEKISLVESLQKTQGKRAEQVSREADLLETVLSMSSDLSQTIVNTRIQILIAILSVVTAVIAVTALVISIQAAG